MLFDYKLAEPHFKWLLQVHEPIKLVFIESRMKKGDTIQLIEINAATGLYTSRRLDLEVVQVNLTVACDANSMCQVITAQPLACHSPQKSNF